MNAVLYEIPIHSGLYGWTFSYQSRRYTQTNNIADALIGNSPIMVDKNSHEVHVLGSGLPVEFYIENYLTCGDPFKKLGKRVELLGWRNGAQTVKAIHAIQRSTGLGLKCAKFLVDDCLDGRPCEIACLSEAGAAKLVEQFDVLGFCSKQLCE